MKVYHELNSGRKRPRWVIHVVVIGFILLLVLLANIFVHIFLPSGELLGKFATNLNHSCALLWSIFLFSFKRMH